MKWDVLGKHTVLKKIVVYNVSVSFKCSSSNIISTVTSLPTSHVHIDDPMAISRKPNQKPHSWSDQVGFFLKVACFDSVKTLKYFSCLRPKRVTFGARISFTNYVSNHSLHHWQGLDQNEIFIFEVPVCNTGNKKAHKIIFLLWFHVRKM